MKTSIPRHLPAGTRTVPVTRNQAGRLALARGAERWRKPPCSFGLRLQGEVNPDLLEEVLTHVARRHTALRTTFPDYEPSGSGLLLPTDQVHWNLTRVDLRGIPQPARQRAEDAAFRKVQEPFAPDEFPLFRGSLLRYEEDYVLTVAVDHMVFDGESIQVFLGEFGRFYQQLACGSTADLADDGGGSDFGEFSAFECDWLQSPEAGDALVHWKSVWDGFGPFPPTRIPVRDVEGSGALWRQSLPADVVHARRRRFSGGYLSLPAFAAAAVLAALRDMTGQTEGGVLHPSSRRFTDATQGMIGYLNNRTLLRADTPLGADLYQIAAITRAAMVDALEHQMMPFEVLLDHFAPQLRNRRPDRPYIHLNVQASPVLPSLPGLNASLFWPPQSSALQDIPWISVDLEDGREHMVLTAGYSTGKFEPDLVSELMARVAGHLTG
ncbi:hypothetical protein AV521_28575 [Streptomyces sp. IMTB 2501]|uniref:condensation domain-containing protein n=1 Tax=Streptomyces sp. IMTB 2501 TaxID=1776340 RepID=UPI00096FC969|nr:condensation domain-containing protein [Streptomyces sp. IMTB 2501]OLZ66450.1 hypothetical protein AV521_28575 [Streptomyces sp. IMTB 2501]